MTILIRLCLAALFATAVSFAAAAPATAHAALVSSDPADSASLPTSPARVTATFNEDMQSAFAAMTVIGPDGSQWQDGGADVTGTTLGVAVRSGAPAGTYTVNYRATSADGHVVSGAWSYSVAETSPPPSATGDTTAGETTTAEAPNASAAAEPADDGMPVWPFVVGAAVIVAGGALWAARRRS
jgi:methionine-rich copper-binding protein CopC